MTVFETVRQGLLVAAELAALLTVTPALAEVPGARVAPAAQDAAQRLRTLHQMSTTFELGAMHPIATLRLAQATDDAAAVGSEEPACGGDESSDDDDDEPSAHVVLGIDEAIADLSVQARAHDPS
jgi:hypothetical protein